MVLHPITPLLAASYKNVRLRALQDAPNAFGSTYQRESQFTDEEWQQRAANLCSPRGMGYLALSDGEYRGIAGCFLDEEEPIKATLVAMWVAPEQRRTGLGRLLVEAIEVWASERGARSLQLMVTSRNDAAMRFYQRLGFLPTGRTEPYPNDPELLEHEMEKAIP